MDLTAAVKADLRAAAQTAHDQALAAQAEAEDLLKNTPQWGDLREAEQRSLRDKHGLRAPTAPEMADDTMLLVELDRRPLSMRVEMAPAYAGKGAAARRELIEHFAPQAVPLKPHPAVISSEPAADEYLAQLRGAILNELAAGHPVSIEG